LYDNYEDLACYAALRIGELITNFIQIKIGKQINVNLNLELSEIIDNLIGMEDDDVLCLSLNDVFIS